MKPWRKALDRCLSERTRAVANVAQERAAVQEARRQVKAILQAQEIVQQVAEAVQEKAHERIASVVTRCLKTVFGEEGYEFQIRFEKKRGRTEAKLVFVRDGEEIIPKDAAGGGTLDVAAFALRLACLMLARPKRRRLLALDEPFRHLSQEYRDNVRTLLLALAKELQVQIVMVTHSDQLKIGKVVEL